MSMCVFVCVFSRGLQRGEVRLRGPAKAILSPQCKSWYNEDEAKTERGRKEPSNTVNRS